MQLCERLATQFDRFGSAIRIKTSLVPVGGDGDKIMPPTYQGGVHAYEERAKIGKTVLLDSVQSQANRFEEVLQDACARGEIDLPLFYVEIPGHATLTSLDVPHRVHDAIFRDCLLDGVAFRQSAIGKEIVEARAGNATAFYRYSPTSLLFGTWDSQAGGGVNSAKVARALVSEIVATGAVAGSKTSSRIDPLGIRLMKGVILDHPTDIWTLARGKDTKEAKLKGKTGKPSEINHGNVTPTIDDAGYTFESATQTTVLSLAQLRRLSFPVAGDKSPKRDRAGRVVLACLGIFAIAALRQSGYQLRSRCQLLPVEEAKFEFIGSTAAEVECVSISRSEALDALKDALKSADALGLGWHDGRIQLAPSDKLLGLVQMSDSGTIPDDGEN